MTRESLTDTPRPVVAVLGTGAVGTRAGRSVLTAGYPVTVWNRTTARADALVAAGAERATTAGDAVSAGPLVLVCLADHAAVTAVLDAVALAGRTVVLLTTGSPEDARATAAQVAGAGGTLLAVGLQGVADDVGTPAAMLLCSGDPAAYDRHLPVLELLGSPRHVGAAADAAAVHDLALYGIWYDAQLGVLRAMEAVRAAGVDVRRFAEAAGTPLGHVVAGVAGTAEEVSARTHPRGPADLVEHLAVLERLCAQRASLGLGDGGLDHVRALARSRIARGDGRSGLGALLD